jgi:hypothetical protein
MSKKSKKAEQDLLITFEEFMTGRVWKRAGKGKPIPAPTKVYRVEMPNGNGPYNSDLPNAREIYETICDTETPGMGCARLAKANHEKMGVTEREFLDAHGEAFYGCDSLKSLRKWFRGAARKYLAGYGATIVVYELPEGSPVEKVGRGEVIFARSLGRKVATLPVTLEAE